MTLLQLKRLRTEISYSGLKLHVFATKIGMGRTTLWKRLNGLSDFTDEEKYYICKVLHLNRARRKFVFDEDPQENYIPK